MLSHQGNDSVWPDGCCVVDGARRGGEGRYEEFLSISSPDRPQHHVRPAWTATQHQRHQRHQRRHHYSTVQYCTVPYRIRVWVWPRNYQLFTCLHIPPLHLHISISHSSSSGVQYCELYCELHAVRRKLLYIHLGALLKY